MEPPRTSETTLVAISLTVLVAAATWPVPAAADALDHTPVWESDTELRDMFLTPPEGREAEALALANANPHCVPVPTLRSHSNDGDVPAIQLTGCTDVTEAITLSAIGGCDRPSGGQMSSTTPVWYTAYADAAFFAHRDAVKEVSALNHFLNKMLDGDLDHGIFQPHVRFCVNHLMRVPTDINNGDVDTTSHLDAVRDYESGFGDSGQFTIVFGWNKIKKSGAESVNGISLGEIGDFPEDTIAYFHYWGGSQTVGFRIAMHEVGHVFDAGAAQGGHSDCTTNMAQHDFFHIMAFSRDRDASCTDMHPHLIFKGPDAGDVDDTYDEWCADRKGSTC